MICKKFIYLLTLLVLLTAGISFAQELEPRAYSVIPKDVNALSFSYTYSDGAIITDATSPLKDFSTVTHNIAGAYIHTFSFFGKLARVQYGIPFVFMAGDLKVNGRDTSGTRTGFADSRLRIGVNIFGSPALAPKDFMKFKEEAVFGASIVVSLPTGQYYDSKIINLGSNRWGFKPEIGFSYGIDRFYFEVNTGVWFFTANNHYLTNKSFTQDPIYGVQIHTLYTFKSGLWFGANGNYYYGGKAYVNDFQQGSPLENSRIGAVLGYPITPKHSIKFQAHTGLEAQSGTNYSVFTLAYQYIWF